MGAYFLCLERLYHRVGICCRSAQPGMVEDLAGNVVGRTVHGDLLDDAAKETLDFGEIFAGEDETEPVGTPADLGGVEVDGLLVHKLIDVVDFGKNFIFFKLQIA